MTNYNIFIKSNEHPRTINTPTNGRVYYSCIEVKGKQALLEKVKELLKKGEKIYEIRTNLGTRIWVEQGLDYKPQTCYNKDKERE